jgi:GNAT superfamily N-acetyltransferase
MSETIEFLAPDEAGLFLRGLRDNQISYPDSGLLEILFESDRINASTESAFLKDESKNVLALALINTVRPAMVSFYTIPEHRRHGFGHRLLVACLERIVERGPNVQIAIESISEESQQMIEALPTHLKDRLRILWP